MKGLGLTLGEVLSPMTMTCGKCGGQMVAYPDANNGNGFCPNCSPAWAESFFKFLMNEERTKKGLPPIS